MSFSKKELYGDNFVILDIGSYKIRSLFWRLSWKNLEINGFWEKRQEQESFFLWEVFDVNSVAENIIHVIKKSTQWMKIDNYIVNLVSNQFFLYSHQLNFVRENEHSPITEDELYDTIKTLERNAIELSLWDILHKSGYTKADLKLALSSISNITIDGKDVADPLWKTWKNIKIYLINIFVPLSEFEIISKIFQSVWIYKPQFIPFEYSVSKLLPEWEDIVIINIWNGKTYISIQQWWRVIWTTRISIGMYDFIKRVKEKYGFTQVEILKNINSYFESERREFLDIFWECISVGIKEIVKNGICPEKFLVIGGGGSNVFMQEYFKNLDLTKYGIKIVKSISPQEIPKVWINSAKFLENASCIDMYSMVLAYEYFEKKKNSSLTKFLEKAVQEIEQD